jgi:hypothetical protein
MSREIATLDDVEAVVEGKGGTMLRRARFGRVNVRCHAGHIRSARETDVVYQDHWCKKCGPLPLFTIEDMKQFAARKGGECLSDEYLGLMVKLAWKCEAGREWRSTPCKVLYQGDWCNCFDCSREILEPQPKRPCLGNSPGSS